MRHFIWRGILAGILVVSFFTASLFGSVPPLVHAIDCGTITIPVGTRPNFSLLVGRTLYVANQGSSEVSIIDTTDLNTDAVAGSITVGTNPRHMSYIDGKLYVLNKGDQTVSVIDISDNSTLATIPVGNNVFFTALVGTKLYVPNSGDSSVTVIDTTTDTVVTTITSGIGTSPYSATAVGEKLYVNNLSAENSLGEVSVIDTTTDTVIEVITVAGAPYYSNLFNTSLYVYGSFADAVTVIDTVTDTVSDSIPFDTGLDPTSGTVVGTKLYVNNESGSSVSVFDTADNSYIDTIDVGNGPFSSTHVNGKLYVNNAYSNTISVIDTETDTVITTIPGLASPQASTLAGANLYVSNGSDNTISVIDVVGDNTFICGTVYEYDLVYTAESHGSITGDTNQTVQYGDSGTAVTAVPDEDYAFVSWSDDSTDNPRTDTNVIEDLEVEAIFEWVGEGDPPPDDEEESENTGSRVVGGCPWGGPMVNGKCQPPVNNPYYEALINEQKLGSNSTPSDSLPSPATKEGAADADDGPVCSPQFTNYLKKEWNNNPGQVTLWQIFLNQTMGSSLTPSGVYDDPTFNETKAFQLKFATEVLDPWGIDEPTGFVYKTTRMKANQLSGCAEKEAVILEGTGKTWSLPAQSR